MFAYIKGELADVKQQSIVVECGGIGYEMLTTASAVDTLPAHIGENIKVFTYLNVREDGITLFGFLTEDELEFFKLLITVNGIGPKGALGILSVLSPDDLRYAILSDDAKSISKAPGIGAKTAGKLILELKDKVNPEDLLGKKQPAAAPSRDTSNRADAIEALTSLGYSASDATKAVRAAEGLGFTEVEELIRAALKQL